MSVDIIIRDKLNAEAWFYIALRPRNPEGSLSPFLIGRMFLREPSWKYSAKLVGS